MVANKGRVLYLFRCLHRCSDERRPAAGIRKEPADKGCPAAETVRDDIGMIRERGFGAVLSSLFADKSRSGQLNRKLVNMAGSPYAGEFRPCVSGAGSI